LERLNRPCQYAFVFRHAIEVLDDLTQLAPQSLQWYNQERFHSGLGDKMPWQQLVTDAAVPSSQVEEIFEA
jgi:hypothetical protein